MIRHWRIEMLGGLRVAMGAAPPSQDTEGGPPDLIVTRFARAKCVALLAFLALHPKRPYAREELAALLWPDADTAGGQTNLRSTLASLRRQLEPAGVVPQSLLQTTRQTVRLNPDAFSCDVADFESAARRGDVARCRELYCGDLLPGLYDEWVLAHRDRLASLWECLPAPPEDDYANTTATPPLPAPPAPILVADRLPLTLTRCFGREADITRLSELLLGTGKTPPRRFVTLTGPGGVGKTRLALEAARTRLAPAFGGAVFWVALADVHEAEEIPRCIAEGGLGLAPSAIGNDPLEAAVFALSAYASPLLVLDNLEQLCQTSAAAALLMTLLRRVPHLTCLATSRRRLHIEGEWEYPLAPLALPGPASLDALAHTAAVQLFVDRAQAARPDFAVTPRNAETVVALCRRLDGLPLAIELVAARSHLTPAQMLAGLSLPGGNDTFADKRHTHEARHHSLHAAIAWSVNLLPPALREFWASLSVWRGGFTADAVWEVLGEPSAHEYLTQLRERSLLVLREAAPGADTLRFGLLETLREFAGEVLPDATREHLALRHATYYTRFAETTLPALQQSAVSHHLGNLEIERPNFNAALHWCAANGETERGLQMGAALWRFWEMRGYLAEGRAHLATFLSHDGPVTTARAAALNGAGMLAARQGDYPAAQACHQQCLQAYRTLAHRPGEAVALGNLGLLAAEQNRYDDARALYETSLRLRREAGDTIGVALILNNLGNIAGEQGDHAAAIASLTESLALRREQGDRAGVAQVLGNLGNACFRAGDAPRAFALHNEGLTLLAEIGDRRGMAYALLNLGEMAQGLPDNKRDPHQSGCHLLHCLTLLQELGDQRAIAYALDSVAGLAAGWGQLKDAALLHGAALALRENAGIQVPPVQQQAHAANFACLQQRLGRAAYQALIAKGRALQSKSIANAIAILHQYDCTAPE